MQSTRGRKTKGRRLWLAAVAAALLASGGVAFAQSDFPTRPVRIFVSYAAQIFPTNPARLYDVPN
jgi:hypothetical protein